LLAGVCCGDVTEIAIVSNLHFHRESIGSDMALTPEEITSALDLVEGAGNALATSLCTRINARLGALALGASQRSRAEDEVIQELKGWAERILTEEAPKPTTPGDWEKGVDQCLANAEKTLEHVLKSAVDDEVENEHAFEEREVRQKEEAEKMGGEAEELGLPEVEDYSEDRQPDVLRVARMDEVVAALLQENEAVATMSLASCTGVSLFDPATKVGAMMHVYQGEVTVQQALDAMRAVDPTVDPRRIQVTLMPGIADGVNTSHLESLHTQLASAGITKVRDCNKEGRTSPTLVLRGDGVVIADMKRLTLAMTEAPKVGGPKKEEGPKTEESAKKPSVREALGMAKGPSPGSGAVLGTGVPGAGSPTTASRMKA
jgi:hypothetical protein